MSDKEIFIVVENLHDSSWGIELYVTFASENEQKVIDYVTKKYGKNKWFKAEQHYKKVKLNEKQKVYLGGYIE